MNRIQLTTKQAQALIDAHEIHVMLKNEEECELLKENNPELLEAYQKLAKISDSQ